MHSKIICNEATQLFLQGLLDYLNQMDELQIRKLYSILITLSFCGEESSASSVQDEVHTVIRKQLSHVDPKYVLISNMMLSILVSAIIVYQ